VAALKTKTETAERQCEISSTALTVAEKSAETLKKLLESTSEKLSVLEPAHEKLKQDRDSLQITSQTTIDRLQRQNEHLQEYLSLSELATQAASIKQLQREKALLEASIASLQQYHLRREVSDLTRTLDNSEPELRKQVEQLKSKVVEQFRRLEGLTKDYQECCKSKVTLIEVNSRLEEDLDRTRMDLRDRLKVMNSAENDLREK
jgi:chromosome segregation ATPase